jgi:hypothetical protein
MSFGDDISEPAKPHELTVTIWSCARCGERYSQPCKTPLAYVREAVVRGGNALLQLHVCSDSGVGVGSLVGGGPGRPIGEVLAKQRAEAGKA